MDSSLRVGIVGCSGIGVARNNRDASPVRMPQPHSHAAAFDAVPAAQVTAVCDVSEGALGRVVETWGPVNTYTDYRRMLEEESLDLLSIVTPDHLHADIFVDACEAAVKGIFCEKPIATTLADADRMIAAAERCNVKALVNHTRRFDPVYRQARWLVEQGAIGPVKTIIGTLGGERAMLFRNGTHVVDTMLFFADGSPTWVIAELDDADRGYGPVYHGDGGHAPESDPGATALIAFSDGARAFYSGSKRTATNLEIELQGETGRIRIGNQAAEIATVNPVLGGLSTQPLPLSTVLTSGMVRAVEELIELVTEDGDGLAALRNARTTLEVVLAMLASADDEGGKVFVSQPSTVSATSA